MNEGLWLGSSSGTEHDASHGVLSGLQEAGSAWHESNAQFPGSPKWKMEIEYVEEEYQTIDDLIYLPTLNFTLSMKYGTVLNHSKE